MCWAEKPTIQSATSTWLCGWICVYEASAAYKLVLRHLGDSVHTIYSQLSSWKNLWFNFLLRSHNLWLMFDLLFMFPKHVFPEPLFALSLVFSESLASLWRCHLCVPEPQSVTQSYALVGNPRASGQPVRSCPLVDSEPLFDFNPVSNFCHDAGWLWLHSLIYIHRASDQPTCITFMI